MKLLKRSGKKPQGRRPEIINRTGNSPSNPVVRYYRPNRGDENKRSVKDLKHTEFDPKTNKPARQKASLAKLFYRWSGLLAIIFLMLANTTLSGTAVKVSTATDKIGLYKTQKIYSDDINTIFRNNLLNKSKFTLNSTKLEEQIKAKFPEVEQATVIIPLAGRKLQVGVVLAKPLARLQYDKSNKQAIISEKGVVIDVQDASQVSSSFSELPIISVPNVNFSAGDSLLTTQEASLVSLIRSEFDGTEDYRYKVRSLEFDVQKREIRVKFEGVNFYAKLTPERDSREQIGSLVVSLKSLQEQGRLPQEYIDVRVEDRVFVR